MKHIVFTVCVMSFLFDPDDNTFSLVNRSRKRKFEEQELHFEEQQDSTNDDVIKALRLKQWPSDISSLDDGTTFEQSFTCSPGSLSMERLRGDIATAKLYVRDKLKQKRIEDMTINYPSELQKRDVNWAKDSNNETIESPPNKRSKTVLENKAMDSVACNSVSVNCANVSSIRTNPIFAHISPLPKRRTKIALGGKVSRESNDSNLEDSLLEEKEMHETRLKIYRTKPRQMNYCAMLKQPQLFEKDVNSQLVENAMIKSHDSTKVTFNSIPSVQLIAARSEVVTSTITPSLLHNSLVDFTPKISKLSYAKKYK